MISDLLTEHIPYQDLPLPAMEIRHILAIEAAIRAAWEQLLRSTSAEILKEADEKFVTIELVRVLEDIRLEGTCPPFDEEHFGRVGRGEEFLNYNGKAVEKRPDLAFELKARRPGVRTSLSFYDRLFAECKVLNQKGADIGEYANNGVKRFLRGDYAWAMPHCLMLGYIRTSQSLPNALNNHFRRNRGANMEKFALVSLSTQCRCSGQEPRVYQTTHGRNWLYRTGNLPGDITRASALEHHNGVSPSMFILRSSSQAAPLRRRRRLAFLLPGGARRMMLRTIFLSSERFCGAWSLRSVLPSSPKLTSSTQ